MFAVEIERDKDMPEIVSGMIWRVLASPVIKMIGEWVWGAVA